MGLAQSGAYLKADEDANDQIKASSKELWPEFTDQQTEQREGRKEIRSDGDQPIADPSNVADMTSLGPRRMESTDPMQCNPSKDCMGQLMLQGWQKRAPGAL